MDGLVLVIRSEVTKRKEGVSKGESYRSIEVSSKFGFLSVKAPTAEAFATCPAEGKEAVLTVNVGRLLPHPEGYGKQIISGLTFVRITDGLLVVGDRVEVLQRISELIDQVEAAEAAAWVVQLYIVSLTSDDVVSLGLDVLPALEVAATVASASNGALSSITPKAELKGGLDVVLQAARERNSVSIVGEPLFLLVDGETSHLGSGQRVPIPLRTVSNQGIVNTTADQFVDTGFQLDVGIREVGYDRTRLTVNAEISSVVGYVDQAPILAKDDFKSASVISSGGVYLLGALDRSGSEKSVAKWLGLGGRDKQAKQLVQVWARAYRIAGPCVVDPRPETVPHGGAIQAEPAVPLQGGIENKLPDGVGSQSESLPNAEMIPLPPVVPNIEGVSPQTMPDG